VDDLRMADIRRGLTATGFDEASVRTVESAWEPATARDYDGIWRRWDAHARAGAADPIDRDYTLLASWLVSLINDSRLGEGSTQKYRSVVESTWHLIHNPQVALQKLSKAAAKLNVPRSKGADDNAVWDLPYLHWYLDNADVPLRKLKYIELVRTTILRLKAALGWRGADLAGLYEDHSFKFDEPHSGKPRVMHVRTFGAKTKKKCVVSIFGGAGAAG
jgi:hypothetical protein